MFPTEASRQDVRVPSRPRGEGRGRLGGNRCRAGELLPPRGYGPCKFISDLLDPSCTCLYSRNIFCRWSWVIHPLWASQIPGLNHRCTGEREAAHLSLITASLSLIAACLDSAILLRLTKRFNVYSLVTTQSLLDLDRDHCRGKDTAFRPQKELSIGMESVRSVDVFYVFIL